MFGLLWLSLAVVLLVNSTSDTEWFNALDARDSSLPLLSASNDLICYYFRLDQPCSATAIKDLLNLGTAPDLTSYSPSATECQELQRGMRPFAQWVANAVFGTAITRATTAGAIQLELTAQIWALQVGYNQLTTNPDYIAFANALNSITDWTTVFFYQNNIAHGEADLIPVPAFWF